MNYKKIVVIKHGAIGDFVMSFRAMKSIREHFSSSYISLVTTNLMSKLFNQIPYFDKIVIDERKNIFDGFKYINYLGKANADLVIDLQNSQRTQFYHFFTRIFYPKIIINSAKKFAHLRYIIPKNGSEHVINGLKNQLNFLNIRHSEKSEIDWLRKKDFNNPIKKKFVLLIPGTSKSGYKKQWSPQNFSKLSQLINDLGLEVVIAGVPSDRDTIRDIINLFPKIISLEEYSDFPNFINLCDRALVIISVDTGPAHIAAYSNTPLIWIIKNSPYITTNKPYSKNTTTIEAEDINSINVNIVFKKVLELIKARDNFII